MTGLHNYRNYREFMELDPADVTFAHVLAQAGYRTVISGKWQLTNNLYVVHEGASPQQAGFDEHRLMAAPPGGSAARATGGRALVTNDRKETWGEGRLRAGSHERLSCSRRSTRHAAADPGDAQAALRLLPDGAAPRSVRDGRRTIRTRSRTRSGSRRWWPTWITWSDGCGRSSSSTNWSGTRCSCSFGDNGTSTRITSVRNGREVPGAKGRSLQTGSHVPYLAWWPGTIPSGQVNETLVDVGDVFPTLIEAAGAGLPPGPRPRRRESAADAEGRTGA